MGLDFVEQTRLRELIGNRNEIDRIARCPGGLWASRRCCSFTSFMYCVIFLREF